MIILCVMLSKNCLYDGGTHKVILSVIADPGGKATCVKADTLGLPSDHMLNYAVFDVVMELVYLLIKTNISDHIGIYLCISAYILYDSTANNYIDNSGK